MMGWTKMAGLLVLLAALPKAQPASDPTLVRGPYLQNGTQTGVTLRWRTSLPSDTMVRFGVHPSDLGQSYYRDEAVTNHAAALTGLQPGTRYYYEVGSSTAGLAAGSEYFFRTAPATNEGVRIWAIGDAGTVSVGDLGATSVRNAYYDYAGQEATDIWLMLGDNAYFEGTDRQYQTAVFDTYPDLLRNTVVWSTVGNHEVLSRDDEGHFPYLDIFSPPQQGEGGGIPSGSPLYYSFDYANAHFVCLDSEVLRGTNATMVAWLKQDLAATTRDWIIAFWHSPPYTKGSHDSDSAFDSSGGLFIMRTNVVPVLESYGVDLVLCGHSHNYERSFLLNGHYGTSDELEPSMILDAGSGRVDDSGPYFKPTDRAGGQGTVYVVNGSSGWTRGSPRRLHPAMFVQVVEIGSVVIDINGGRLDARFLRDTGAIDDYFTMIKSDQDLPFRIRFYQKGNRRAEVIMWDSDPGQRYQVEISESLTEARWEDISGPITASGLTASWTNDSPALLSSGYYRIRRIFAESLVGG